MNELVREGSVLIEDGTRLPESFRFNTTAYVPRWGLVRDQTIGDVDRQIRAAGWNFHYFAGELKTWAMGPQSDQTIRRAISRLLANLQSDGLNCMQVTQVAWLRRLGLSFVRITAHSRHIQKGIFAVKRNYGDAAA